MKVFVSYAGDGKEIGRAIVGQCNENNIEATSYDLRIMSQGRQDPSTFIENELQKFDLVIVVWSIEYSSSAWLQRELFSILNIERFRAQQFVIPVCIDDYPLHTLLEGKGEVVFSGEVAESVAKVIDRIPRENRMFVVMAFGDDELDSVYKTVIKPTVEIEFGYTVERVDERETSESISQDIIRLIRSSAVILCDITHDRPNVYFETGYALGLNREIILTCREGTRPHFDVQDLRAIRWKTGADFQDKLRSRLIAIRDRRVGGAPTNA